MEYNAKHCSTLEASRNHLRAIRPSGQWPPNYSVNTIQEPPIDRLKRCLPHGVIAMTTVARAADDKQLLHPLEWQTFKKEYPCISTGA